MKFYISICKDLSLKNLNHTENTVDVIKEQMETILTCRKSILIDSNSILIKKKKQLC